MAPWDVGIGADICPLCSPNHARLLHEPRACLAQNDTQAEQVLSNIRVAFQGREPARLTATAAAMETLKGKV